MFSYEPDIIPSGALGRLKRTPDVVVIVAMTRVVEFVTM